MSQATPRSLASSLPSVKSSTPRRQDETPWKERWEKLNEETRILKMKHQQALRDCEEARNMARVKEETISSLQRQIEALKSQLTRSFEAEFTPSLIRPKSEASEEERKRGGEELVVKEAKTVSRDLLRVLKNQRVVALRSRRYATMDSSSLSLTPRQAADLEFGCSMAERFAFQSGQVLKRQMAMSELREGKQKLFSSMDVMAEVRLREVAVRTEEHASPNVATLAVTCDLLDKLCLTAKENPRALKLLRRELLAAIFCDYSSRGERRQTGEQHTMMSSYSSSSDYDTLVPFFVQVKRIETSLATAEEELAQVHRLLSQSQKRQGLVKKAINVLYGRQQYSLAQLSFHLWVDRTLFQRSLTEFAFRAQQRSSNCYLMIKVMFQWMRFLSKSSHKSSDIEQEDK
uniref:Uncharacterized protein n=1 Tax=Hanusia phi TaxID=3032 RepID=A0A7S0ETA5_9CRYP|mmetsp:Transcript_31403/g.70656  ORF Transcript_31403/g.70656 Transcript_31403/m.70656 type:complete len:403 (+) Transcript_31403:38-1246(+)